MKGKRHATFRFYLVCVLRLAWDFLRIEILEFLLNERVPLGGSERCPGEARQSRQSRRLTLFAHRPTLDGGGPW